MAETSVLEVRAEALDESTSRLTVTGDTEIIAAAMLLIVAAFADDDEDCGDPDCPVHGEGAEPDDEDDLAGSA